MTEALADHGRSPATRVEPSKMSLSTYLVDEWLPTLNSLKPTTRDSYRYLSATYVVPTLGDVRLCDVTAGQIAKLYEHLRTKGRIRPKKDGNTGLSESSVHHVHVVLSAAFGHAVEAGFLRVSPVTQLP